MNVKKLSSLLSAGVLALTLSTPSLGAELRIGVEGAYPPFSWKKADGTLTGFDIDIAMVLCEEMGRKCTLVEQDWDGMIPALMARKFDAIVASMSITEERKKRVNFSVKYYNTPARLVAKKDSGLSDTAQALAGQRVGVQRSTTHQCYVEKAFPEAELVLYTTQEEVFQDLAAGRLDAQMSDSLQAIGSFLSKPEGQGFAFLGGDHNDQQCHGEGAGVAVRKADNELLEALNKAIETIRANGIYKTINDKYFDIDIYGG
ncbi:MAG: transporter substrate-binding domain-containing protein [Gammaproteobacteria bacterium]|nr:transporter substrate-binding domain-containing protein [Gammaproteobacteria bacterium]